MQKEFSIRRKRINELEARAKGLKPAAKKVGLYYLAQKLYEWWVFH